MLEDALQGVTLEEQIDHSSRLYAAKERVGSIVLYYLQKRSVVCNQYYSHRKFSREETLDGPVTPYQKLVRTS